MDNILTQELSLFERKFAHRYVYAWFSLRSGIAKYLIDMYAQNVHYTASGKVNWKTRRLYIHPFRSPLCKFINTGGRGRRGVGRTVRSYAADVSDISLDISWRPRHPRPELSYTRHPKTGARGPATNYEFKRILKISRSFSRVYMHIIWYQFNLYSDKPIQSSLDYTYLRYSLQAVDARQ